MKISCFISHNSREKVYAEKIGNFLLSRGVDVWYDSWEIFAGESITDKIANAIDNCNVFIILLSIHSKASKWVKEELRIAINRRINDDDFVIIPIRMDSDVNTPAFLRDYRYLTWTSGDSILYENLLNSIYRVSPKPIINNEDLGHVLSVIETNVKVEFIGHRGEKTIFKEHHKYKVIREFDTLNKRLYYDGSCTYVKNDLFDIKRNFIKENYEEIEYTPKIPIAVGDIIDVREEYELLNNFASKDEYWIQHLESPPEELGKLTMVFDFSKSTAINSMRVFQRERPRPIEDIVKPQFVDAQIVWTKVFTKFLDMFTFRFSWVD